MDLDGKCVVITGGTAGVSRPGDFGRNRLHLRGVGTRQLAGSSCSRCDEAKQHYIALEVPSASLWQPREIIYENSQGFLAFRIGDVRDYSALLQVVREADVVFHAAALKQVPTCEYFPLRSCLDQRHREPTT